ncbi:retrotransposon protein [Cucumis melo var. makuwa]|uniref:Retrotransposon protein n=2 Tax=Cucumis melo TaxID=3656 RepID=A0A5A7UJ27_CUCMM|nr:retrotransposon protein [Cucumis melo var. makuwa]
MNDSRRITHTPSDTCHRIRQLAYFRMIHESDLVCRQSTHMDKGTFAILCHLLQTVSGLLSTEIVNVEKMVAMFLHVLAHDVKSRVIQREFVLSDETVSQHFNLVLLVVVRLYEELIKRHVSVTNNYNDQRWKCFENFLGALDGTYIKVNIPTADRPTFRTHKGEIATNVLGVCNMKGDFVYVLAGWEGSVVDSGISRPVQRPTVPLARVAWCWKCTKKCKGVLQHEALFGKECHSARLREMTYCDDVDDVDEGDFAYATTTTIEEIHYIEMTNEWSQWRDKLAESMFTDWQLPKGLLNKSFLYYDELTYVFSRDRATGWFAKTFVDVKSNKPSGYEGYDMVDQNEEFPSMYSQGIDMSQDDVRASRPSRTSEGRTGSSGSKRKRGSQREVDVKGIHLALDQTNEQLMMIAKWPARALANDNHVRTKFFCILREMLELTSLDRTLLQRHLLSRMDDLRGSVLMPEDEKEGFCRVLLRDMTR